MRPAVPRSGPGAPPGRPRCTCRGADGRRHPVAAARRTQHAQRGPSTGHLRAVSRSWELPAASLPVTRTSSVCMQPCRCVARGLPGDKPARHVFSPWVEGFPAPPKVPPGLGLTLRRRGQVAHVQSPQTCIRAAGSTGSSATCVGSRPHTRGATHGGFQGSRSEPERVGRGGCSRACRNVAPQAAHTLGNESVECSRMSLHHHPPGLGREPGGRVLLQRVCGGCGGVCLAGERGAKRDR